MRVLVPPQRQVHITPLALLIFMNKKITKYKSRLVIRRAKSVTKRFELPHYA